MFAAFRPMNLLNSEGKALKPGSADGEFVLAGSDEEAVWMMIVNVPPRIGDGFVRQGDDIVLLHHDSVTFFGGGGDVTGLTISELTENADHVSFRLITKGGTPHEIGIRAKLLTSQCSLTRYPFAAATLEERAVATAVQLAVPNAVSGTGAQELVRFLLRNKTRVTRETVLYYAERMGIVSHSTATPKESPASATLQLAASAREKGALLGHAHRV